MRRLQGFEPRSATKKATVMAAFIFIKYTVLLVFRGFDFYWKDAGDFDGFA